MHLKLTLFIRQNIHKEEDVFPVQTVEEELQQNGGTGLQFLSYHI